MTASQKTINQLADMFEEYLIQEHIDYATIALALRNIEGSKSVVSTCRLLAGELMRRAPRR